MTLGGTAEQTSSPLQPQEVSSNYTTTTTKASLKEALVSSTSKKSVLPADTSSVLNVGNSSMGLIQTTTTGDTNTNSRHIKSSDKLINIQNINNTIMSNYPSTLDSSRGIKQQQAFNKLVKDNKASKGLIDINHKLKQSGTSLPPQHNSVTIVMNAIITPQSSTNNIDPTSSNTNTNTTQIIQPDASNTKLRMMNQQYKIAETEIQSIYQNLMRVPKCIVQLLNQSITNDNAIDDNINIDNNSINNKKDKLTTSLSTATNNTINISNSDNMINNNNTHSNKTNNTTSNNNMSTYVWSCGQNSYGELGHIDLDSRKKFQQIEYFKNKGVHSIGSGNEHSAFVTSQGIIIIISIIII